ncbi:putative peptidase C78, ubiquitin modifier-specific peptidase 1/ 2 [Lupinus albus]|uniref:Putative peptidase C78, ubiquitin modifier-specific peptidase 1/ 2 n=1 Tax=Lupinus albus TaxID=3870 RepID=A0A6A4PWR4_LUPAL|nr:putative peptidase C78, ubiquitin modifier-specific peptidase 1/ 2 [Lupinus albus]
MESSTCPFCHLSLPSLQLQWHANTHFHDDNDHINNRHRNNQLATDFQLAQQLALSLASEQADSGLHFDKTGGDCNIWCGGVGPGRNNGEWKMDEKTSCLVELQRRSKFHKVEAGLMALLRSCLELEAENSRTILSGYVDHFQSIEFEDVGWGCGWRNIQMLSSHLLAQRSEAREILFGGSGFVPDIPSLQRWLEIAWERGFDASGSDQFDHAIYGMKKWIGTTECAALFRSFGLRTRIVDFGPKESGPFYLSVPGSIVGGQQLVGIDAGRKRKALEVYGPMDRYLSHEDSQASCSRNDKSCSSLTQLDNTIKKESGGDRVVNSNTDKNEGHQVLMDFVWNYFSNKSSIQFGNRRVIVSEKSPLYFQHDGHSRTIVGIQVKHQRAGNLQYNLLVLDPGHRTAALEKSLREKVGWQKLVKRGTHTLKKAQYQLCYVDPGIASEEEMEKLKTIDSVFLEF